MVNKLIWWRYEKKTHTVLYILGIGILLYLNPLLFFFFFWQIVVEIEVALAANPDEKINLIRCPFCKQKNLRKNQDNHIRCWNCTRSTCFQCKKAISENPITKHFSTPNLCKQHSSWQIDLIYKANPEFLFSFLSIRRPCLKKSWPPIGPIHYNTLVRAF